MQRDVPRQADENILPQTEILRWRIESTCLLNPIAKTQFFFASEKQKKKNVKRVWALRFMKCQCIGSIVQGVI